jgi:hypothetical protein
MRTEPATEQTIAAKRKLAQEQPTTGLPELARELLAFGWHTGRDSPKDRIPYFEEATAIYRGLVAGGSSEHLAAAAHAISSLGLQYSLAHADDRALTAKTEAAALARQMNQQREGTEKESRLLMELAHGLAEAGRFTHAVTTQLEVVDIHRTARGPNGYKLPDNTMWALLDLAIYLDLDGQIEASLDIDRELLDLERCKSQAEPRRLTELAIWTAGLSTRFLDARHQHDTAQLLAEAIAACDRLPPDTAAGNFGFLHALQAALFARSGTKDEHTGVAAANPISAAPQPRALEPVLGLSYHHWSFSVRQTYRAGHEAIDNTISALAERSTLDPADLHELGTLTRRRTIRQSVQFNRLSRQFTEQVIPALDESVAIERQLLAAAPNHGHRRLIQALTDQAMGHLVTGSNSMASTSLREARELLATIEDNSNRPTTHASQQRHPDNSNT